MPNVGKKQPFHWVRMAINTLADESNTLFQNVVDKNNINICIPGPSFGGVGCRLSHALVPPKVVFASSFWPGSHLDLAE